MIDLRPLDAVRSIKVKLGLLVVASVVATALLTWYGLVILGFWPRYTLPFAVVVSLGVTQVLAHGMTEPLRRMTVAARIMAAGGTPPPLRVTSRDEVGELAGAFTAMAHDLEAAQQQRRDLLANVGHEIRTPVAALRAQLENLVDGVRVADRAALEEVLGQAVRLGDLVEDLLDLARAEGGGAPFVPQTVEVAAVIEDAVHEIALARPDARLSAAVTPGLTVTADPRRLRQVLVNLLDNAARHASSGAVDVTARPGEHGGLELVVRDDGPGIPPEQRDAVFGRFETGDSGPSTSGLVDGGTGLGLAIARWAVALHGGRIDVLPEASGCSVRVLLPHLEPANEPLNGPLHGSPNEPLNEEGAR
jgi:signal transduction histidine kinase